MWLFAGFFLFVIVPTLVGCLSAFGGNFDADDL